MVRSGEWGCTMPGWGGLKMLLEQLIRRAGEGIEGSLWVSRWNLLALVGMLKIQDRRQLQGCGS